MKMVVGHFALEHLNMHSLHAGYSTLHFTQSCHCE